MKNQKIICIIAAVALMVAAVFCGYRIYSHYAQVDEQTEVLSLCLQARCSVSSFRARTLAAV